MLTALVAAVALAVVAGLAVALARARSRADDLARLLREATAERHRVEAEAAASRGDAAAARRERDEAFERVQRARRDAAEVAERLEAERTARASAEEDGAARETELAGTRDELAGTRDELVGTRTELAGTRDELVGTRDELDAVREELRVASEALTVRHGGEANDDDGAAAWALTCTRVEHVWRTSVALGPDEPSPLVGDDPLRAAIEVLVTAVREEAGADVEVTFAGGAEVGPAPAVALLALVEVVLLATAKADAAMSLAVTFEPAGVEVVVRLDGRAETPPGVPDDLVVGPGRYLVPAR